jgi:putative transposase
MTKMTYVRLYEFRRQLEYKAKWYGREIIVVDRFFPSSKTCSKCGWINHDLTLADRTFVCRECGNIVDRDFNASINIKNEGVRLLEQKIIGQRLPEFMLADDLVDKEEILCYDRMKQEENLRFS